MSNFQNHVYDESERQFHFLQALKKLDFFASKNFMLDENETFNLNSSTNTSSSSDSSSVEEDEGDKLQALSTVKNNDQTSDKKTIDLINEKISKLDSLFSNFNTIKPIGRPSSYEILPDSKNKEEYTRLKEKEKKEQNLFAGIFSMKSVIYDLKTTIPPTFSMTNEEADSNKVPKLVELYQYTKYDNKDKIELPHDIILDDVLSQVLDSISILEKQPHYRVFLYKCIYSDPCKFIIHDTFWWCFLQRYQRMPTIQHEYFNRVSENYVKLIFTDMDFRYRDTFFKSFANLLAMCVYTIFCSCFPQSYATQFNDDFKEFICQTAHTWISGCTPVPRSYSNWNFKKIDPPSAIFAQEVLNKKQNNILDDIANIGTAYQSSISSKNQSRTSNLYSSMDNKKTSEASSLNKRRPALIPSVLSEEFSNKSNKSNNRFFKTIVKKESHPACKGPEYENCLFDIFGKSPLVNLYLTNHNAFKINNYQTLIKHTTITQLPPLNAPTYQDVINESLKKIKKYEKELKLVSSRQEKEYLKLHKIKEKELKEYSKNIEKLLSNPREVAIMGELITMNSKKDQNSTNFPLDQALKKAFQNSSKF